MADSTVTATVYAYPNGVDNTQRREIVTGTLAISVSPGTYTAGGYSLTDVFRKEPIKTTTPNAPSSLQVYSVSGSGYVYSYVKSTNKLMVLTGAAAQSALTQLSNGSTPAGVSGDTIEFRAEFPRGI